MKAEYIGTQERFTGPPLILVNVKYSWGVNTEVYEPLKHELSDKDLERIREEL